MASLHRTIPPRLGRARSSRSPATGSLPTGYRPRRCSSSASWDRSRSSATNGPIRLGGPRQRATLAILLLHANRVVPVERLADELYAGRPPVTAVTQVQRQVSELRRALGSADAIETRPPGYVLRVRDEDVRPRPLRAPDARRPERARARDDAAARPPLLARGARALARAAARRPRLRAVRPRGRRAARGAAPRGARGADRRRARARAARGARRRARGARRRAPAARAAARPADARALPLGPPGRGARGLPRDAAGSSCRSFGIEPSAPLRALEHAILTQDASLELGVAQTGTSGRRRARRAVARRPRSMRCSRSRRRSPPGASSSSRGSSRRSGSLPAPPRPFAPAAHRRARRRSRATIPPRTSCASRRPTMPTSCWSMRRRARRRAATRGRSPRCSSARPRTWRSSPAAQCVSRRTRSTCRSAAASTTGPRSSSARGSRPRRRRRCGSSARARIRAAAAATPAVCWPTRRSPCSGWSRSTRRRCSPNPTPPRSLEAVADGAVVAVGVSPRWRARGNRRRPPRARPRRATARPARPPGPAPGRPRAAREPHPLHLDARLLELVAGRLVQHDIRREAERDAGVDPHSRHVRRRVRRPPFAPKMRCPTM